MKHKGLISLFLKLCLITSIAAVVLLVGIVFTTVVFPSDQYPSDLGRTWQDALLIFSVLTIYVAYTIKVVVKHFKGH